MRGLIYRNYMLALLTVIMIFNYVDRIALGLMLQDIKVDLDLSDTQLGLLTGIAFALFYASMGIPIARWADRGNRVTIIAVCTGFWSALVALCGTVGSFTHMLLVRICVAVGEAGCHPPAFSLISDYFARAERPRAVARYMLGWPLALLIGYFAGGWLNELYGWRTTFIIIGVPGLVLAALAALTLREPRRARAKRIVGSAGTAPESTVVQPGVRQVLAILLGNATYRHLLISFSLSYFFGNGILQWLPAFFIRSHGFGTQELGTWFAVIYGLGSLLGTWLGGELAAHFAANNERLQLKTLAALYISFAVLGPGIYLAADSHLAFAVLTVTVVGKAAVTGPMFAATQTLVPPHMRAMSIALVLFFSNLIGLGFGPLAVGALSDALRPWVGEDSLRYALLAMSPGYVWCARHLWRASRTVSRDVATAQAADDSLAGQINTVAAQ